MSGSGSPRVSVIIPAYNAESVIEEAVGSILDQSFQDFEIIALNDASRDGTLERLHDLASRDSRIQVVDNPANLGIAGNRNRGLELAEGELVAWQDADDISMPQRLAHQVELLDARPEVGMVGGSLEFFGGARVAVRSYAPDDATLRRRIFRYMPVAQPAAMLRRAVLRQAGAYETRYEPAEDLDMAFRIGRIAEFANLQEVVLRYREDPSSATFSRLRKIERDTLAIRRLNDGNGYRMTTVDRAYNRVQQASMIMPASLRIRTFNLIRNRAPRQS